MADLTQELEITTDWTEITTPLMMVDGDSYLIDVNNVSSQAVVYSAETDSALPAPSAGITGHPVLPSKGLRSVDSRIYPKRSGVYTWMRVTVGVAKIAATKAN